MKNFNKVQNAAFELIQKDALFLFTLLDIYQNANNIKSNYISMTIPYIGIFADGAEQWGRKMGLQEISFSAEEKQYYCLIRNGHKLYEKSYNDLKNCMVDKLKESDNYFYSVRSVLEKVIGYNNFGVDKIKNEYCGNTILCAVYSPFSVFDSKCGPKIKKLSEVAGNLVAIYCNGEYKTYQYNKRIKVKYADYNFSKYSPIKGNSIDKFVLFCILCNINYSIVFIEKIFIEEIVQKLKFAYIQYYYLCDFVNQINNNTKYELKINSSLYNREFRNCLVHYGLGQYMQEKDIDENDPLKGLTMKAFKLDYMETKKKIYIYLNDLAKQIKHIIF